MQIFADMLKQLMIGIMQKQNTEVKKLDQKSYFLIHKINAAF